MKKYIVVFDIDGTLSVPADRLKYIKKDKPDWDSFYEACDEDEQNIPIACCCRALSLGFDIVYITGRPESTREKTVAWLEKHGLPTFEIERSLYMRADGDHRDDTDVKFELLKNAKAVYNAEVLMVFEDRTRVVKRWRELGYTCLQVADGNY